MTLACRDAHLYATVLHHRHGLLVRSVLMLLRREANASNLTGVYRLQFQMSQAHTWNSAIM